MSQPFVVTATLGVRSDRLNFLPRVFGRHMIYGENLVYQTMRSLCPVLTNSDWDFYSLSNGGGYMAPQSAGEIYVTVKGNGFDGAMPPDAAGIVVTLFALRRLANLTGYDEIVDRYHQLRSFAVDHPDAAAIFAAID